MWSLYQIEINRILSVIINTFFYNVIRNPVDARNKLELGSLNLDRVDAYYHRFIYIAFEEGTDKLTITGCNGLTITDKDVTTIAGYCTNDFLPRPPPDAEISMIGQFGYDFYTAYLVAEWVATTKDNGDEKKYVWECKAGWYYTVTRDTSGRTKMTIFQRRWNLYATPKHSEFITLKDYFTRMKEGPNNINWIENKTEEKSIFLDRLVAKGYTVHTYGYEDKLMYSATMKGLVLDESEAEKKKNEDPNKFEVLCKKIKRVLGNKVEDVVVSDSVMDSPCRLVTGGAGGYGWTANMEMIMKQKDYPFRMRGVAWTKKMEINPNNSIIEELRKRTDVDKEPNLVEGLVRLLYVTSMLTSGFSLREYSCEERGTLHKFINRMLVMGLIASVEMRPLKEDAEGTNMEEGSILKKQKKEIHEYSSKMEELTRDDADAAGNNLSPEYIWSILTDKNSPIIEQLTSKVDADDNILSVENMCWIHSNTSALCRDFNVREPDAYCKVREPNTYCNMLHRLVKQGLKLHKDEVFADADKDMPVVWPLQLFYMT